jgi:hypothetical protein
MLEREKERENAISADTKIAKQHLKKSVLRKTRNSGFVFFMNPDQFLKLQPQAVHYY